MLTFIHDCCKDQNMCNKVVDNYAHASRSVPNCFKTQKKCVIKLYLSTIQFVPDRFKTQEVCDKAVDTFSFVFDFVPDWDTTQKLSDKVVSEDPFLLKYCHDK